MGPVGYYRMLAVIFTVLILSVIVQGRNLFSDPFFAIAYAVMSLVLFIGTKWKESSRVAMAIGLLLIFSIGFLSTDVLVGFFSRPAALSTPDTFFKLAIVFSLDASALFFLRCGVKMRKEEQARKKEEERERREEAYV